MLISELWPGFLILLSLSSCRTPPGTVLLILIGTGVWLPSSYTREEVCVNLFVRETMSSRGVPSEVCVLKSHPDTAVEKSNQTQRTSFLIAIINGTSQKKQKKTTTHTKRHLKCADVPIIVLRPPAYSSWKIHQFCKFFFFFEVG